MSLPVRGQRTRTQVGKQEQSAAPQRDVDLMANHWNLDQYCSAFESHRQERLRRLELWHFHIALLEAWRAWFYESVVTR